MDSAGNARRQALRPSTRRLIQLYSALLYNAHVRGFIRGEIYQGAAKYACVPGLNCYSCPGAVGACPLGALQNALAASGHRAGWYVLGILLLYGVALGRTICGWLCPAGLIQELLHRIPTPKLRKSPVTRALSWLKYAILAVLVAAIPLWYGLSRDMPLPAFCKYICTAGTFEGAVGLLSNPVNAPKLGMLGLLFTRKFVIMVAVGLACVFCYRAFCRFLCPLGAIYSLFNRFSFVGVRVDAGRCNHCGACARSCGMDVRHVGDRECIQCAKCMGACSRGAISLKAGRITLKAPAMGCAGDASDASARRRRAGRALWGVALAILCLALLWFNALDPSVRRQDSAVETTEAPAETAAPEAAALEDGVPVGSGVGERLADFTAQCLDGSTFRLADARGKVVFINLWATYCTPCIQELPYFDALYRQREGDTAVLAVHSSLVTDDPAEYLADKGYAIAFATDGDDDAIFNIVGGSATLPQTIVLNRRGEVVYNQVGSVTPEMLDELYRRASE